MAADRSEETRVRLVPKHGASGEGLAVSRKAEPITVGVPWPKGVLVDPKRLALLGSDGEERPLQHRALDFWSDGSVRWLLVDSQVDHSGAETYTLEILESSQVDVGIGPRVVARQLTDNRAEVDTRQAVFQIETGCEFPFSSVHGQLGALINSTESGLRLEADSGKVYVGCIGTIRILDAGPVRACIEARGRLKAEGREPIASLCVRYHFFAGSATVKIELTILNPRAAQHPGGIWCLGDPGSMLFKDLTLCVALPEELSTNLVEASLEIGEPFTHLSMPFELYQDSSGGERWRSSNHVNRRGEIPVSFRGYTLEAGSKRSAGLRSTPIAILRHAGGSLGFAMPRFWENFPKAIETDGRRLLVRLFPRQFGDLHELQGGEQKTHCFYLAFEEDRVTKEPLEWCRNPLVMTLDRAWVADSGAIPWITPRERGPLGTYQELVDQSLDSSSGFVAKREEIDEYGWRNFGDLYADHEAAFHTEESLFISHYNNQYDAVLGFAIHFLRSGDLRWLELMGDLAAHVVDIDIYHTDQDRAAYNHGLFWHTTHYVDAGQSTHRSYPRHPQVGGGGPNPSHLYTSGLLLHHYLTGSQASKRAVLELSKYVLDVDDGRVSRFRLLDQGETGIISESLPGYHGPGRAPGNALNALLDGFRLTGDRVYIAKAEELIRRCIHPADDLAERRLDEPEYRWFYTIFLQALGKYLDTKIELDELDSKYAYGRASLLHYARWAANNERPWLERPELLEFPTETWAAQDMRKAEVFRFAIRHAEKEERLIFKERADFFFRHSTAQLSSMPTRGRTRPVVLILVNGYGHSNLDEICNNPAPVPQFRDGDFGDPISFVSQKVRILRKLYVTLALASLLAILGLALIL